MCFFVQCQGQFIFPYMVDKQLSKCDLFSGNLPGGGMYYEAVSEERVLGK